MAKRIAEQSNRLSIFWLKKHGYLHKDYSIKSGGIKWTYGWSGDESSISFCVYKDNWGEPDEHAYIRLFYTNTDCWTEEKTKIDYKVQLTTTKCNYGGKRYWFICPLVTNDRYCGRRVGVLYTAGKYFGCRHCADIAYAAQMRGGRYRGSSVTIPDMEKLEKEIKRYYYNGKPTRKYKRLMKMDYMLKRDLMMFTSRYGDLGDLTKFN